MEGRFGKSIFERGSPGGGKNNGKTLLEHAGAEAPLGKGKNRA